MKTYIFIVLIVVMLLAACAADGPKNYEITFNDGSKTQVTYWSCRSEEGNVICYKTGNDFGTPDAIYSNVKSIVIIK